jgi:hypothetical protein
MKLPIEAVIAREKLLHYLLKWRPENDKSLYLAQAGYTAANAEGLAVDMREQLLPLDAEFLEATEYGQKYVIRGNLRGPNGVILRVVTIWMKESATGLTKFVTLFPAK